MDRECEEEKRRVPRTVACALGVQIWVFVSRLDLQMKAFVKRVDVGNGSQNGAEGSVGCYCWLHRLCTVCRVCDGSSATHC